jgi:N6-adenosine-specific RNA methylase IME4
MTDITVPPKRYKIIYADPAWKFKNWTYGVSGTEARRKQLGRPPYPTMSIDELKAIRVQDIASRDSILLMWVTSPKLVEGLELIKAWGFTFKTVAFCWVKLNKVDMKPITGMGYHTRSGMELCLLATRGSGVPRRDATIKQVIFEPRTEHSVKPKIVYNLITRLYGNVPRVELFARNTWEGFDAWGNEVENTIKFEL